MATTEFIAAIELGSSKITGVAGRKNSDGSMQILAYAQEDSSTFIRKGVIFNLDKTAQSLTSIINRLEGELKNSIAKVYVGIGGQSLRTVRNVVSRDLEEEAIISEELVSAIGDENIAIPVVDMDILDVAPQEYKVGNNLQANPVGLVGSHIEGRFLNIVARSSVRKNLEHCFQQAKIDIADQLIAPLVTANAVLTESERRSGCALIDFGADTTTISVYKNNILRFLTVLPLGGNSITRDITTLQMEEEEAERLKRTYGDALYEEDESEEPATCKLEDESRTIELSKLNNIIEARTEEIIANVWNQIQISGYEDKLLAGIILTGGAANLKNLDETLRKRSKIEKIRMAKLPRNTVHAPNNILKKDGSQNTLFGLLFEGNQNCCLTETAPQAAPAPSVSKPEPEVHKTVDMFEDDQELKEQARLARLKKDEEEKEARAAAKEAERLRKQKEKEEKELHALKVKRTETFNKKQTLDPAKEKAEIKAAAAEIKKLDAEIKALEKATEQKIKEHKNAVAHDAAYQKSYQERMEKLKKRPWFRKAVKIAISIGQDADDEVLIEFTGNKELVLQANNATALAKMIKWASTTASMVSAPSSKPMNFAPATSASRASAAVSMPADDPFAPANNGAPLVLDMSNIPNPEDFDEGAVW